VLEERLHRRSQEQNRLDDSEALIKKRLDIFEKDRMPIVQLFTKSKNLIHINS
jgi:adenylate kinase family enzyme